MKLCIQVELDDNAKPDEIGYALREAAMVADNNICNNGSLELDEERDLPYCAACVINSSIFRPE